MWSGREAGRAHRAHPVSGADLRAPPDRDAREVGVEGADARTVADDDQVAQAVALLESAHGGAGVGRGDPVDGAGEEPARLEPDLECGRPRAALGAGSRASVR